MIEEAISVTSSKLRGLGALWRRSRGGASSQGGDLCQSPSSKGSFCVLDALDGGRFCYLDGVRMFWMALKPCKDSN